jgi:hypothetical protein
MNRYVLCMRFFFAICALFALLPMLGCATQQNQITPEEAALEKYDQRGWNTEEGRVR